MPRRPQRRHRQSVSDVQAVVRRPIASIRQWPGNRADERVLGTAAFRRITDLTPLAASFAGIFPAGAIGPQSVTVEDSMSVVHASPAATHRRRRRCRSVSCFPDPETERGQPQLDVARLNGNCHQIAGTRSIDLRRGGFGTGRRLSVPQIEDRERNRSCKKGERRANSEQTLPPHYAARLRVSGAMNSGPIGLAIVSSRMRSISAWAEASSRQPMI
jgi:hypothetical protein